MKIPAHVQWLFDHSVGRLADDEDLLRAILSMRSWTIAWEQPAWTAYLGDIECPYGYCEAETLLEACLGALRSAVKWDETRHMRPHEVAFIEAVLAAREGGGT